MSAAKSERLMNLLIMLLVQKRFLGKQRIREALYPDTSTEAFEKMFERDKEELRSLGATIEVGTDDAFFDDEVGYRIRADQFYLPDIHFDADEAGVVSVATRVWDHAGMASAAAEAGRKLTASASGTTGDDHSLLDQVLPRIAVEEPSYEAFMDAAWSRTPVAFNYARAGQAAIRRHLHPWGVVRSSGRWYVVGWDTDRDEQRVFRLSRVQGHPIATGDPGSFVRPDGVDSREIARRLAPPAELTDAVVDVRPGSGQALRRYEIAETPFAESATPTPAPSWDRITLQAPTHELIGEILAHGAQVRVVEPDWLRDEVVNRLNLVIR